MVQVLSKYVEIDQEALEVLLEKEAGSIGLVLNIPIRRVKSEAEAAEALAAMQSVQEAKDVSAQVEEAIVPEAAPAEKAKKKKASKEEAAASAE
jgi:hypothetical protein